MAERSTSRYATVGEAAYGYSLHLDSQKTIRVAHNSVHNGKKRHIHIRHSVVKQLLKHDIISLEYVKSEKNIVSPHTKGLTTRVVLDTSRGMGVKPMN